MRILKYLALVLWLTASGAEAPSEEIAGIGVALGVEGQNVVVKRILPDSPAAAQNDIHVGDRIMAIGQNNEPAVQVQNGKLAQAVALIRGSKGTTVRLTIIPFGENDSRIHVVSFVRGEVKALSRWGNGALLTNGMKAPDIEMVGLTNGTLERLSDYADKVVVLEFWATWCGPCQKSMADFQSYSGKHPNWKGNVILIAASVDDNKDMATEHLKANGWNQTHNVWVGTAAIKAFEVDAIPTVYVIDWQGKIVTANPADISEIVNHEVNRAHFDQANDSIYGAHCAFRTQRETKNFNEDVCQLFLVHNFEALVGVEFVPWCLGGSSFISLPLYFIKKNRRRRADIQ